MEDFLTRVHQGLTGFITLNTKSETGLLDSERFFEYPKQASFAAKVAAHRYDEDVYTSVCAFSTEERSNQDPDATAAAVWADADTCHPDKFRLKPSIVVNTSPGRWHVWWLLDKPVPAAEAQALARKVYEAHKDDGCDRGWTMTKLLRVPGTLNTKYDEPYEVTAEDNNVVYTVDQFAEAYADVSLELQVDTSAKVPAPVDSARFAELEDILESAGLTDLYLKKPAEGQSWSERMFRLELELFRQGLTPQEVFSLMREAPANKYRPENAGELTATGVRIPRRSNPDKVTWIEVQKAHAEYLNTPIEVHAAKDSSSKASFLTMEERALLADNPSFIDRYVDWALTRSPDSAPTYHRSLAFMLLSCTLGDRFTLGAKWTIKPNLWVMILGDSTLTHKSASGNLFLKTLDLFEAAESMEVNIGSDTSTEALIKLLGQRDGMISLLHTDEVARFYSENLTKTYRAGTMELFTELYDGKVPVSHRINKESGNKNRAETVFNFLGIGIRRRVAEILNRTHFESGFLMRAVWSIADPPKYKKGDSDYLQIDDEERGRFQDPVQIGIVQDLLNARGRIESELDSRLLFTPEALERLNEFAHEMHLMSDDDTLHGAVMRVRDSVVKGAALLAWFYGDKEIGMYPLLCAIAQGELWFNDLRRMLDEVSDSAFGGLVDRVLTFLLTGDNARRSEAEIYRKFSFKPTEFNEVVTALAKRGQARRVPNDPTKVEAFT